MKPSKERSLCLYVVRAFFHDPAAGLGRGPAVTDHLEAFSLEQVPHPLPGKLVMSDDKHAHSTRGPFPGRSGV